MISLRYAAAAAALAGCMVAGSAVAQDWRLAPHYGETTLVAGFLPDPQTLQLQAGGTSFYSHHEGWCEGYVAEAPDYRLHYTTGQYQLAFYATSSADTMIVVNAPDGSWHCNDDYRDLDPAVVFSDPMSGQYDIWVGTFSSSAGYPNATLYITEMMPFGQ